MTDEQFKAWQEVMQAFTGRMMPREVYDTACQSFEDLNGLWPMEGSDAQTGVVEEGSQGMEDDARRTEAQNLGNAIGSSAGPGCWPAAGSAAERRIEENLAPSLGGESDRRKRIREHLEGDMKLTEHEYIVVSNLARVRMMSEILGKLYSIWGVLPADDLMLARVQLTRWTAALEDEVNKLMGKKMPEKPDA